MRKRINYNPLFYVYNIKDFKYLFYILTNQYFNNEISNLPDELYLYEMLNIIAKNNKN